MRYLVGHYDVSQRRASRVVQATRSLVYYRSRKLRDDNEICRSCCLSRECYRIASLKSYPAWW